MFLVRKFHQFHAELSKLTASVSEGAWLFEGEGAVGARTGISPEGMSHTLQALLERQKLETAREGGDIAAQVYVRAQYAMAALADERFLTIEWGGRNAWRENLLEKRLFDSRRAGQELFERIDDVLERDSMYAELARVYLMVLALGFQGRYRDQPGADATIAEYRRRLFRFIYGRHPQALRGNEHLVPQAYAAAMHGEGHAAELPYLRRWVLAFILIVGAWLAGSELIWRAAVSGLDPLVDDIQTIGNQTHTSVLVGGAL
jgi:type VI secretion system protein ImpK